MISIIVTQIYGNFTGKSLKLDPIIPLVLLSIPCFFLSFFSISSLPINTQPKFDAFPLWSFQLSTEKNMFVPFSQKKKKVFAV